MKKIQYVNYNNICGTWKQKTICYKQWSYGLFYLTQHNNHIKEVYVLDMYSLDDLPYWHWNVTETEKFSVYEYASKLYYVHTTLLTLIRYQRKIGKLLSKAHAFVCTFHLFIWTLEHKKWEMLPSVKPTTTNNGKRESYLCLSVNILSIHFMLSWGLPLYLHWVVSVVCMSSCGLLPCSHEIGEKLSKDRPPI